MATHHPARAAYFEVYRHVASGFLKDLGKILGTTIDKQSNLSWPFRVFWYFSWLQSSIGFFQDVGIGF